VVETAYTTADTLRGDAINLIHQSNLIINPFGKKYKGVNDKFFLAGYSGGVSKSEEYRIAGPQDAAPPFLALR
jgi:hypothetical protein